MQKAVKAVKLRNATRNLVKRHWITLKCDTSIGNVNAAKYTKAAKRGELAILGKLRQT